VISQMDFSFSPEQEALRMQLRAYFADLPAEDGIHPGGQVRSERDRAVVRRLGADGWLGIGFPREYGGQGRDAVDQFIFYDEAQRAGVPIPHITLMTVAPALLRLGTEEQRRLLIPGILRGDTMFAIGYSEPAAGTDLGALTTAARREEDAYVVNGHKYFTSGADTADYVWLAVRTDPASIGYHGLSVLVVPTTAPGFTCTPVETLSTHVTAATYYHDVRVPLSALVGEENEGWQVITGQLNLERLVMVMPGRLEQLFDEVVAWVREMGMADEPWVRVVLGQARARIEAHRLLAWRAIWLATQGPLAAGEASAVKVFGSESYVEVARLLLEVVGSAGYLADGAQGAPAHARLEELYRAATIKTFGGGVNEIQREIVAQRCLGLPRVSRRLVTQEAR
jgi:alkylation response protein AidB-like acyl-CoA dehydrogenase